MAVDISRALKISNPEWMSPGELRWLAEQALSRKRILELGTYQGRSACAMLDSSKAHIWCVDSWNCTKPKSSIETYRKFLRNVKHVSDRVTALRMSTATAVAHMPTEPFDMVFIDAAHTYELVRHDILSYAPLVRPGGLLCGHDYHNHAPGVLRAVHELLGVENISRFERIWWIKAGKNGCLRNN